MIFMYLNITLASETRYNKTDDGQEFNILEHAGIQKAYEYTEQLAQENENYIVVNIDSQFADWNPETLLDDVVEVAVLLNKMTVFQQRLFIEIAQEQTHEPFDVAYAILNNDILEIELIDEDDIWETVTLDNEVFAISH